MVRLEAYYTHIRAIEDQFSQVIHINGNRQSELVFSDIVDEIDRVIETRYNADTKLQPFGILVLGVPGSNKTEYARLIARMSNSLLCDVSDLLLRVFYEEDKLEWRNVVKRAVESGERVSACEDFLQSLFHIKFRFQIRLYSNLFTNFYLLMTDIRSASFFVVFQEH
jgi:hypothetical protein